MRIGIGYDIHPLVEERPLVLGGVKIPFSKGPLGFSDADVLLHAIIDSILGALGKGDIGEFFPDTDPAYKDIESTVLLKRVVAIMEKENFNISNLDTMVILEQPHLSSFKQQIRRNVASLINTSVENVNIKAGTNEKLGFFKHDSAIAAYAVVLIKKGELNG